MPAAKKTTTYRAVVTGSTVMPDGREIALSVDEKIARGRYNQDEIDHLAKRGLIAADNTDTE